MRDVKRTKRNAYKLNTPQMLEEFQDITLVYRVEDLIEVM